MRLLTKAKQNQVCVDLKCVLVCVQCPSAKLQLTTLNKYIKRKARTHCLLKYGMLKLFCLHR